MRNWFLPAFAIVVVSLYAALGWQQLVAASRLVSPSSADPVELRQQLPGYRFGFDRGGRGCAMPTWQG